MNTNQKLELERAPTGRESWKHIGPGVVWAALAIGGGELVLIPRVGAVYGMMFM
jgi:hypothetical protein